MLSDENLLIASLDLAKSGQRKPILLLLSQMPQPSSTTGIRARAIEIGFRAVIKWNVTDVLKSAARDKQVAQVSGGWKMLGPGLRAIDAYYTPEAAIISEARHSLRSHLEKIADGQRRVFVEEAIKSFDVKAHRAAIVLSWVGAAHIIQEHIVSKHVSTFNAAGIARAAKASANGKNLNFTIVKSLKDFGVLGEADMLQICQDAGILHKAEKQVLQDRLDLRNQCGHPNPLTIAEHTVANHIELLMLNVYSKY
jgi:hypothetical protein